MVGFDHRDVRVRGYGQYQSGKSAAGTQISDARATFDIGNQLQAVFDMARPKMWDVAGRYQIDARGPS
ncbi:hypothetical protein ANI02nite_31830 [Acetobacter nitrogenifigens DSM 23921 = NBRC 105050]|uniref:Uncharacterized protein n=1 Tax=Acetobacter nitrogenifigens DSM 23921 = NBRC 105050 TaxID=1120919 RepID=A0A511XEC4_9PROT|nr:hypothetical protein ANI02nite_31830 [Acetobacter nitrogenifigens DSM 23921 = NBRC 105050]